MRPVSRAALLVAAALAAAPPLAAQRDTVPQQRVHVVQPGETLWDIARVYLNDPFLWPEIFRLNTNVVEDPALIYPRERLVLPFGVTAVTQGEPGRTIFYHGERQVRPQDRLTVLPLGTAQFPVVRMGDFYRASFVTREGEVQPIGRLAELISPTVVPLERPPSIQVYDKVFVALAGVEPKIGDRVQFVREGRELRPHGRVYVSTGVGTVAAIEGYVATVVIVRMYDQVAVNDLAVPMERFPVAVGARPAPSQQGLQGAILGFERPHPAQAVEEITYLDVGREAGVREGDEFEVYLPRQVRNWGTRPEVPVARMQVVKVTRTTASARITSIAQPAVAVGLPVRRVAAMPGGGGSSGGR